MITKFGKRFITNYLAGNIEFTSKELAFGIGSTTPNANGNDTKLDFEFYRVPVSFGSIDIRQTGESGGQPVFSYVVIYKATIPQDVAGVISEIGLYPTVRTSTNNYDSKFITSFENNSNWVLKGGNTNPAMKNNNTTDPFTAKIGNGMVQVTVSAGETIEYQNSLVTYDISGYSVNDSIALAYKLADDNVSNIRVKFYSSDSAYCWVDFTPELMGSTPDKIQSLTLDNLFSNVSATAPDLTSITKVGVEVTADVTNDCVVYFDGIRINDEDTFDPTYGMISRSVLTGNDILVKPSGRQVDIEYKLELGF